MSERKELAYRHQRRTATSPVASSALEIRRNIPTHATGSSCPSSITHTSPAPSTPKTSPPKDPMFLQPATSPALVSSRSTNRRHDCSDPEKYPASISASTFDLKEVRARQEVLHVAWVATRLWGTETPAGAFSHATFDATFDITAAPFRYRKYGKRVCTGQGQGEEVKRKGC